MFLIICIATILLIIYFREETPERKGKEGEMEIASILKKLPSEKYMVIHDVLLKTSYGTSQIDHIVLSEFGIFVIETKNYSGWIYGGENSEYWTKNIFGNKYTFRNPLKQNYAHIKSLMEILNIHNTSLFIPIIAFSNEAEIKIRSSKDIINFYQIIRVISCYQDEKLTKSQLQEFAKKLLNFENYTQEDKEAHITKIKNKVYKKNIDLINGRCPKCGKNLVKRTGKYGEFLGCSNYPQCRFTKNF